MMNPDELQQALRARKGPSRLLLPNGAVAVVTVRRGRTRMFVAPIKPDDYRRAAPQQTAIAVYNDGRREDVARSMPQEVYEPAAE